MRDRRGRRRRAKHTWVRELDRNQLHALAGSLNLQRQEADLTDRQEWLWDQIMIELAWRRSHALGANRCSCMWCTPDGWIFVHTLAAKRFDGQ